MRPLSTFSYFFHECFPDIPLWHWAIMIFLSCALAIIVSLRIKPSIYGSVFLGLLFLMVLFLLDALVGIRLGVDNLPHFGFDLAAEFRRIVYGRIGVRYLLLFNASGFMPIGFFMSAFLTETKHFGVKQQLRIVILSALGLSLCIEFLQLFFRLGWFEVTDIIMNLLGAMIGAGVSLAIHLPLK